MAQINCIAIIGASNNLLYIHTPPASSSSSTTTTTPADPLESSQNTSRYHFLCHTACDVLDDSLSPDAYLGLLYAIEDMAVFGYRSPNTRIKFLIVVRVCDMIVPDADVKAVRTYACVIWVMFAW